VQFSDAAQKSEPPPLQNGCSYEIKNCDVEVTFNDMIYLLNFMKTYQLVQIMLLMGGHTDGHADR
jgi:hypothetical protein